MAAAQGTPESDAGSFECFQNYTAPEVFVQGLAGIVDQQDVESMIRAQKQMRVFLFFTSTTKILNSFVLEKLFTQSRCCFFFYF